jgi:Branched-chain amino acid aminotransferase/4-amino-4-deoxychorismate lyase
MNVFFVFDDGSLLTPPLGTILPGITRDSIIALAKDSGTRVREEAYTIDQWRRCRQRKAERGLRLRHGGRHLADRQGVFGERRFSHQRRRGRPRRHGMRKQLVDIQYGRAATRTTGFVRSCSWLH